MSRYIDAEHADFRLQCCGTYHGVIAFDTVKAVLNDAPSIDIVRCAECKYKRINEDGETRYYYCALEDRPNRQWSVDDTDYCSWGEVRDE